MKSLATLLIVLVLVPRAKPQQGSGQALVTGQYTITRTAGVVTIVSVTVTPSSTFVTSQGTQQFTATVTGTTNTAVTWTAAAGSISTTGLFTAPLVTAQTPTTVTATSQADPSKSATASVTVQIVAPPPSGVPWAGILSSTRAIDWSHVGIPGGIPYRTTQCGATVTPSGVIDLPKRNFVYHVGDRAILGATGNLVTVVAVTGTATSGTGAVTWPTANLATVTDNEVTWRVNTDQGTDTLNIRNAILACPANQVVQLSAGTFIVYNGINFATGTATNVTPINNITLRGMGADQTIVRIPNNTTTFTQSVISLPGTSANINANPGSGQATYAGTHKWLGGYAQGTTVLQLDTTTGISRGQIVILDQRSDDIGTLAKPNGLTMNGCTALPCTVTVTTSIDHPYHVDDTIGIGFGPQNGFPGPTKASWRGWWKVTAVPSPRTFQYQLTRMLVSGSPAAMETLPLPDDGNAYVSILRDGLIWTANNSLTLGEGMNTGRVCQYDNRNSVTNGGTCEVGEYSNRPQNEIKVVTAVDTGLNQITISPPIYATNFRASQAPGIFWLGTTDVFADPPAGVYQIRDGIEDLTVDGTPGPPDTGIQGIFFRTAFQCWLKGTRVMFGYRNHVRMGDGSMQNEIRDNYFFNQRGGLPGQTQSQSYAIELSLSTSDNLVTNNVCQHSISCLMNGGQSGNVWSYNYMIDDGSGSTNLMWAMNSGNHDFNFLNLIEGNNAPRSTQDITHGNAGIYVYFRNRYRGQSVPRKLGNLYGVQSPSYIRGTSYIGNVIGTAQNNYQLTGNSINGLIWALNGPFDNKMSGIIVTDPFLLGTMMRWGNYDTATGATRWCGAPGAPGWSNNCNSIVSATYKGGGTANGQAGTQCRISFAGGGATSAYGLLNLTGQNTIANPSPVQMVNLGWNYDIGSPPTSGTLANSGLTGTATCSGTAQAQTVVAPISEVPVAGAPQYFLDPNPVPASLTLPASFYLSAPPPFWNTPFGTPPWPPIGPDVTGSTHYDTTLAGNSYPIPSQLCWENTPIDPDPTYQRSRTVTGATWTNGNLDTARLFLNDTSELAGGVTFTLSGMTPSAWNGTYQVSSVQAAGPSIGLTKVDNPGSPAFVSGGTIVWPNARLFNAKTCYPGDYPVAARQK